MAITQVRAQFNGQWYILTLNAAGTAYEAVITPDVFSGNQPGGYYNVTVEATNDSGVVVTADGSALDGLRLVVRETVAPVITLVSPTAGYVTSNTPTVTWSAADNAGGSGIDPNSVVVTLDGAAVPAAQVTVTAGEGGTYTITYTPAPSLADGPHTVAMTVSDNDGNPDTLETDYIIDTTPPVLDAALSFDEVVVDAYTVTISGAAADVTASPVSVSVENNGEPVETQGAPFEIIVPLNVGENHITVTATDAAGLTTSKQYYVLRLVTDRLQSDVDELNDKGTYNASDLNRVNTAMDYINGWMLDAGYSSGFTDQGITWTAQGIPVQSQMAAYLSNVEALKGVFALPGAPDAPETMQFLSYIGANNIETILVMIDTVRPRMEHSWFYSNEIFCGEV